MKLIVTFDVEGPAERFLSEEWPEMLDRLYAQPQSAMLEAPLGMYVLPTALPSEEGEVKP